MASWTPKIVGGTDTVDAPVAISSTGAQNPCQELVVTTHEKLADYCNTIPANIEVRWEYGPVVSIPDGTRMQRGQTVTEYRDDVAHQVYWVPS